MVIFRENTEDIYAGIEFEPGSSDAQKMLDFLQQNFPKRFDKIRFGTLEKNAEWLAKLEAIGAPHRELPVQVGIGIKPVSRLGTERLVHSAISYAIDNKRKSVTLVHKGNIMKFTEGAFRDLGYQVAREFFGAVELDGGPWHVIPEGKPGAGADHQGCDRRCVPAADPAAPERIRRHRHAQPQRRLPVRRARRAGRRHRHRAGRATSTTSPATRCSKPRTAPRRSTPTWTRSIRVR